jgi:hypothetical protein
MNLSRKIELVKQAILSISTHDDAPRAVVEEAMREIHLELALQVADLEVRRNEAEQKEIKSFNRDK